MAKSVDNSNLAAKLELRRHFLRKYHSDGVIDVLECCQGSGVLWGELRKEFPTAKVWGVDVKAKKGRLKVDSARIVCQRGWTQNVVDIDTYGSPFGHWFGMLPHVTRPVTVFLTLGWTPSNRNFNGNSLGGQFQKLPPSTPSSISAAILKSRVSSLLTRCCDYGLILIEAVESIPPGVIGARYFGVRIEPAKTSGKQSLPASRSKHSRSKKETEHV